MSAPGGRALTSLVERADRIIDTRLIAEQWDRLGQFYASIECGHVAASVALKRLVGYSPKNRFYRAARDLGRIFKTEFILQYLSQPEQHLQLPHPHRGLHRLLAGQRNRSSHSSGRPRYGQYLLNSKLIRARRAAA